MSWTDIFSLEDYGFAIDGDLPEPLIPDPVILEEVPDGWGGGGYGETFWGGGDGSTLRLLRALAIAENVIRLTFNNPPRFTGLLDYRDSSSIRHYSVQEFSQTKGLDGEFARPVRVIQVKPSQVALALGLQLDITVDRALTHYPAIYTVSVSNLMTTEGYQLAIGGTLASFYGLRRAYTAVSPETVARSRDIANPQTRSAALDPLPNPGDPLILGTIPVNEDGDYAYDEGVTNLKKRIFRRLLTIPGAFAYLPPDYGVGLPQYLKRLGQAAVRAIISAEAERQIALEPEVEACKCDLVTDAKIPNSTRVRLRVRTRSNGTQTFTWAFAPIED